jgi:acetoin utilization protein AcuB
MIKAKDVLTVTADATLEEASRIMVENRIGGLPVLEDGIVTGILTEIDLLAQLTSLLGGNARGVRVTVRIPDRIGEFAKVTGALAANGWGIYASGGAAAPKEPGYWDMVVKVRNVSKDDLVSVLGSIQDQRIIDAREM